jgi:predicted MFS family arabinose efflux permease
MNGRVRVDTSSPPLLSTYPFGVLVALALPISSPVAKIALTFLLGVSAFYTALALKRPHVQRHGRRPHLASATIAAVFNLGTPAARSSDTIHGDIPTPSRTLNSRLNHGDQRRSTSLC